jgi:hypothetical protein
MCIVTKERQLVELFLLCWQGHEIEQVDQSSGARRLQGSQGAVSTWTSAHRTPCLVACCVSHPSYTELCVQRGKEVCTVWGHSSNCMKLVSIEKPHEA